VGAGAEQGIVHAMAFSRGEQYRGAPVFHTQAMDAHRDIYKESLGMWNK
jgi:hypothetical protein